MDGIFGCGRPRPKSHAKPKKTRKAAKASRAQDGAAGVDISFNEGAADEEDEELPAGSSLNWGAYKEKVGITPIQDAVTIRFAEYASLYGRIAG